VGWEVAQVVERLPSKHKALEFDYRRLHGLEYWWYRPDKWKDLGFFVIIFLIDFILPGF
jgi:hypothetical protein